MSSCWKQPTPTDIRYNENIDVFTRSVFYEFWPMVRREPGIENFWHGNRYFSIELQAGQCIFKYTKFADEMKNSNERVKKSLEILSNYYTELEFEAKPFGLVITVKDWEELIKFEPELKSEAKVRQKRGKSEANTSKENVKSVENVKNNTYVSEVYEKYKQSINSSAKLTDKGKKKILTRLKSYSVEELGQAMANFSADSWWVENNAHRGVAWFFDSDDRIEQFLLLKTARVGGRQQTPEEKQAMEYIKKSRGVA